MCYTYTRTHLTTSIYTEHAHMHLHTHTNMTHCPDKTNPRDTASWKAHIQIYSYILIIHAFIYMEGTYTNIYTYSYNTRMYIHRQLHIYIYTHTTCTYTSTNTHTHTHLTKGVFAERYSLVEGQRKFVRFHAFLVKILHLLYTKEGGAIARQNAGSYEGETV